jgi:hypothetical protein
MRAGARSQLCGARVRGRDDEEERMTALGTMEREGCPIKERSLPGVGAHDAHASSLGHAGAAWRGIMSGLHPEWLELGEGLTPLLRDDLVTPR